MSFPRYAAYKDSGVEWLGEVPQGWEVWKLSHFAPIITCGVAATPEYLDDGVIFLSAQNIKRRKINLEVGHKYISQDKHDELTKNRSPIKGDILLSRVGTIGEVCIVDVDYPFSIFVSLTHIRLDQKTCINSFFVYVTQSAYVKALHTAVTLVGGGVGNLNVNDLREYQITLPPLPEQTTIAAFLDCETAKIDNLINEQKKLIELLKEKRQAVISTAVTKGLNPHAPMKDSGVEWLGEVPEHWGVLTAKRISKIFVPQRNKPQLNTTADGISWVTMEDMKTSEIITTNLWVTEEEAKIAGSKILPKGAVISSCVGNFGVASINMIDVIINQQLQAFIPSHTINPIFLLHCTRCAKSYFEQVGTAATLIYVNQQGFENMPLAVPPQNEQELIVAFLDQETAKIDNLIQQAQKATTLLQERRTALISAAVTGKIDVRNKSLPASL